MINEEIHKQFQFFAESDWNSQRVIYLDALARIAAVTAERDQARQMLTDAWDEGFQFGWHSTELRTDENPYREAGL